MIRTLSTFAAALLCSAMAAGSASAQAVSGTSSDTGTTLGDTHANTSTSDTQANTSASASASGALSSDAPNFLGSVKSKSTPARGLGKAGTARVDRDERRITAELNRASAASTGNANASNQASINAGSTTITQ